MKEQRANIFIVYVLAIISFVSLTFSVSYSYLISAHSSTNVQSITTGNITSTVTFNSSSFDLESMSDSDGLSQTNYGTMNVSKTNNYSEYYVINVGYSVTSGDLLPAEYIHLALFEVDSSGNLTSTPVVGPVIMADLPVYETNTSNLLDTTYVLTFGSFASSDTSQKYALKAWLSEDIDEDYEDYLVYLKLGIYEETKVSKQIYNISGYIYDSGSVVSNASISLLNGAVTTSSDSNGKYTLSYVPVGTYNLKVSSSSKTLNTMIRLESSTSNSVSKTTATSNNQIEVSNNSTLQASALTYYQTPYKIKNANASITSTNEVPTSTYIVPFSYKITGTPSLDLLTISNVNIDIGLTDDIITYS